MHNNTCKNNPSYTGKHLSVQRPGHLGLSVFALLLIGACTHTMDSFDIASTAQREQTQKGIADNRVRQQQKQAYEFVTGSSMATLAAPSSMNDNPTYTEQYQHVMENGVFNTRTNPLSTFSVDVDTASYSNVRRMLNQGFIPPADAVRIEEMVNYFDYQYPLPVNNSHPFVVNTQVAASPWQQGRVLMRIGIKAPKPESTEHKLTKNLVFLLDVSGSMNAADKLPLVKRALTLLTQQLSAEDRVAIVVYAGASGVVLEPTSGSDLVKIEQALAQLSAGGSTNGGQGIELAYKLATQSFKKGGINRVILATDGDFNVGMVDHNQLIELIERQRALGIELTTLGFGQGNYNDHLMEQLADKGNGNYAYIDSLNEARKVLVQELDATLGSVAKDVKIQVEFNPNTVAEYRLIGYENRQLKSEEFNNDKVDAGEVGAGHTVTAFYELVLQGDATQIDALRYQSQPVRIATKSDELGVVKLRYKPIDSDTSQLLTQTISQTQVTSFEQQSSDFKFAASVIGFAQILKNSQYTHNMDLDSIISLANQNKGSDDYGYRAEFVSLVRMAKTLRPELSMTSQIHQGKH